MKSLFDLLYPNGRSDVAPWHPRVCDCCGKSFCGRCMCNRNEGERPLYHWYRNNDINWCGGAQAQTYNCSTAVVVKTAKEAQPEK